MISEVGRMEKTLGWGWGHVSEGVFCYLQKLMLNFQRRGERQDKNSDQKWPENQNSEEKKGAVGQGMFPHTSSPGCVVLAACTEDTRRSETTGIHTLVVVVLCVAAGCAIVRSLLLLCADVVWYTSYVSKEHDGVPRLHSTVPWFSSATSFCLFSCFLSYLFRTLISPFFLLHSCLNPHIRVYKDACTPPLHICSRSLTEERGWEH